MPRAPRPDDLYRLRIATEPRLSPDGRRAVVTLQTVAPGFDGYRHALWLVADRGRRGAAPADARRPARPPAAVLPGRPDARVHLGPARDGRGGARPRVTRREGPAAAREDKDQVYLLPLDGGEARRLTDLPRGVDAFEWSPDGTRLVVVSASHGATAPTTTAGAASTARPKPRRRRRRPTTGSSIGSTTCSTAPASPTTRSTTCGWSTSRPARPSRLTDGRAADGEPAWSPDGRGSRSPRTAGATPTSSRPGSDIHVVDVATRAVTAVTRGPRSMFFAPTWLPDGATIAALGHRLEGGAGSRNDIWLFAADGSDATPTRRAEPVGGARPDAGLGDEQRRDARRGPAADRRRRTAAGSRFSAPIDGAYELWRIAVADGRARAAHRRSPLHLGLGRRPGPAAACASSTCARRRPSRPTCGCSTCGGKAPSKPRRLTDLQRRGPRRARPARAARAPRDGRRPRHPGLVHPGRRRPAAARRPDPRRSAHALRLVAVVGVPDPRGGRDRRLLLQPARLGGLRRGVQRRQPPRLGTGSDARRPGRRRRPRRRRPGRPGSPGRHRRLVRRLPHELDRRPRPALPGGDDLLARSTTWACCS